jgi:hypothetical protein
MNAFRLQAHSSSEPLAGLEDATMHHTDSSVDDSQNVEKSKALDGMAVDHGSDFEEVRPLAIQINHKHWLIVLNQPLASPHMAGSEGLAARYTASDQSSVQNGEVEKLPNWIADDHTGEVCLEPYTDVHKDAEILLAPIVSAQYKPVQWCSQDCCTSCH